MDYFYSPSVRGFFVSGVHEVIPDDAIGVSAEDHQVLISGQSAGKVLSSDAQGRPVLVDPAAPSVEQMAAAARLRRMRAYAEEADPLFFKYQREEATREEWLAKVEEIKQRFPDPSA